MQEAAHDPLLPSVSPAAHGDHVAPSFYAMALGSIGIVYGDIGTSRFMRSARRLLRPPTPDRSRASSCLAFSR